MAEAIPFEIREQAEELFIIEGLALEQVAKETGISIQALKKWSAKENWPEKRAQYRRDKKGLQGSLMDLRTKMLSQAIGSLDPQDVYALVALEKILGPQAKGGKVPGEIPDEPMTKEELLTFIKENVYGLR